LRPYIATRGRLNGFVRELGDFDLCRATRGGQIVLHLWNIFDLPDITVAQIQHFFEHYKDLEPGKWVKMVGWGNCTEARQLIVDAIARAKD
jgi:Inorganic pyrophosphatase